MPKLYWQRDLGFEPPFILDTIVTNLSGSGYAEDPFIISSVNDLLEFRNNSELRVGYYRLLSDIDMSEYQYSNSFVNESFFGSFDGKGYSINNLDIKSSNLFYSGFFVRVCGTVNDLHLLNVSLQHSGSQFAGGITAYNSYGTISNCSVSGAIYGNELVGSIAGANDGMIYGCCSSADVVCNGERGGGIVGDNWYGTVKDCYMTGTVLGYVKLGGIAGFCNGYVTNCYSTAKVDGSGICGYCFGDGEVENCFWDVEISEIGESGDQNYGAVGKTTKEMQTLTTYVDSGWDFVGEDENGNDDYWKFFNGGYYPVLNWQRDPDKMIYNVRSDTYFRTIQGAIDDAIEGDVITLEPGKYSETFRIDKDLTLKSVSGNDTVCIDGSGYTSRIATLYSGVIDGITFTNCGAGAVYINIAQSYSASIKNCSFNNNSTINIDEYNNLTIENGGAVLVYVSDNHLNSDGVSIENCSFSANVAERGGAVAVEAVGGNLICTISDCIFEGNFARESSYCGAGICCMNNDHGSAIDLIIDGRVDLIDNTTATILDGSVVCLEDVNLNIDIGSILAIDGGSLFIVSGVNDNVVMDGGGTIRISKDSILHLGYSFDDIIPCSINIRGFESESNSGNGSIAIDLGVGLELLGAVINLSDDESDIECVDYSNNQGAIFIKGTLDVGADAKVFNTYVEVSNLLSGNKIVGNNIRLCEASTGFGGQFYVKDNAQIKCNYIVSEGDRYLDLDPDPFDDILPDISGNTIDVIINEGANQEQGTLLELRAGDYSTDYSEYSSGVYQLDEFPDFSGCYADNWVLDKLTIIEGAKLNLTNRQGFEFIHYDLENTDVLNPNPETVYIKDLILQPNAVLNTALQTLYYQNIIFLDSVGEEIGQDDPVILGEVNVNGSIILDEPLLGFDLAIIAMDDDTEFFVRVQMRETDQDDEDGYGAVMRADYGSQAMPGTYGDKTGGAMILSTHHEEALYSASSVAAKGAFARAGDENILVQFEYIFTDDGINDDAELIVYMSDRPDVGESLIELARIRPPKTSRPGSVGSEQFAVFSGTFPKGTLNFKRGTYIELELFGEDSCVMIDNWDPWVACAGNGDTGTCGDYGGTRSGYEDTVDFTDYLILLSEVGLADPVSANKGCLDLFPDGMVTMEDVGCWGTPYMVCYSDVEPELLSVKPLSIDPNTVDPNTLLPLTVASLPAYPDKKNDIRPISNIYGMMPQGDSIEIKPGYGSGRLVSNRAGDLYQLDFEGNVWEYFTGFKIISPAVKTFDGKEVTVGTARASSVILTDIAFAADDDQVVYVVPVLVNSSYKAAARLQLTETGYEVTGLYGIDPADDENQSIVNTLNGEILYEPDTQHIRELEVDSSGSIYVISSHYQNQNSWLLRYDQSTGQYYDCDLQADYSISLPSSMKMSGNDILYISTSEDAICDDPNNIDVTLYGLDASQWGSSMNKTETTIRCPAPLLRGISSNYLSDNYIAMITSITEDSSTGNLYVVGYTAPQFNADTNWSNVNIDSIFTTGFMAEIPYSQIGGTVDAVVIGEDMYSGLRLPMSVVWTGEPTEYGCNIADIYPDNKIDLYDFAVLSSYWLSSESVSDIYPMPYGDNITDISDLAEMADCWLEMISDD